jgi:hypothetical protein
MFRRCSARLVSLPDAAAAWCTTALQRHLSSQTTLRHINADILKSIPRERTRNLSIIAHVDHGKSTLSDRLMELTLTISGGGRAQYLDKLQVERERGITIKAQTVSMLAERESADGTRALYLINLIDTPGHVDFSYEVSFSCACEQRARVTMLRRYPAVCTRVKALSSSSTRARACRRRRWPTTTPPYPQASLLSRSSTKSIFRTQTSTASARSCTRSMPSIQPQSFLSLQNLVLAYPKSLTPSSTACRRRRRPPPALHSNRCCLTCGTTTTR